MHWETKEWVWITWLWHLLGCSDLEPNLGHLRGRPVPEVSYLSRPLPAKLRNVVMTWLATAFLQYCNREKKVSDLSSFMHQGTFQNINSAGQDPAPGTASATTGGFCSCGRGTFRSVYLNAISMKIPKGYFIQIEKLILKLACHHRKGYQL